MRIPTVIVLLIATTLAVASGHGPSQPLPEEIDLVLPGKDQRFRLQLTVEGQSPTAAWGAFLDSWFDWFDRDGDGCLSRDEAARVFALPLTGQRGAHLNFDQADANKDGKLSREEMKAFYSRAGFTPVLTAALPTSLKDLQIAEALFRHFGPDGQGRLTPASLKRIANLLRKLDENEDGILTAAEVLSLGADQSLKAPPASECQWVAADKQPAAVASVFVAHAKGMVLQIKTASKSLEVMSGEAAHSFSRVRFGDTVLVFSPSREDPVKSMAVTRQFVLAQFNLAGGSKKWVEKRQLEDDASLQLLADIFPHANRAGNGKLTLAELEQFLTLAEQGIGCCLVLTLHDAGRNLFDLLDANGDGRLDTRELHAATSLLRGADGAKGWLRTEIPLCARITVQRGVTTGSFGLVPLITLPATAPAQSDGRNNKGPSWFRAMDRNGDGLVSPEEFLGPPELFRRLDLNSDGFISVDEAESAEKVQTLFDRS